MCTFEVYYTYLSPSLYYNVVSLLEGKGTAFLHHSVDVGLCHGNHTIHTLRLWGRGGPHSLGLGCHVICHVIKTATDNIITNTKVTTLQQASEQANPSNKIYRVLH